jgi:hypothetical protein
MRFTSPDEIPLLVHSSTLRRDESPSPCSTAPCVPDKPLSISALAELQALYTTSPSGTAHSTASSDISSIDEDLPPSTPPGGNEEHGAVSLGDIGSIVEHDNDQANMDVG